MRRLSVWTRRGLLVIEVLAGITAIAIVFLAFPRESTAQTKRNLLGGPRGVVRTSKGFPVEGLMVQLISQKNSIRTTVFTNEIGKYEFPKIETGDYVLRIPRPLEFRRYEKDSIHIDGAPQLEDITLEQTTDSEFLPPTPELLPQLTEAEWIANLPGTGQEKKAFVDSCGGGCHGLQKPFRARFDEANWRKLLRRMAFLERIVVMPGGTQISYDPATKHYDYKPSKPGNARETGESETGRPRGGLDEFEITVKWLSRVRGPDAENPPMKPFPRPQGPAARAIITEYELPWVGVNVHDVTGDAEGNIWFTINRSPFIGKLDPKTGKVTQYRTPIHEGIHPGEHFIRVDKSGIVWFSDTWSRSLNRLDPKTGKIDWVYTGLHGNVALAPDGSIWRTDQGKIKKYDPKTVMETGKPVREWSLHKLNNTYGNFISKDGKYFGGGGQEIVFLNIETGEVREAPAPSGDAGNGRGDFDPEGNIWVGSKRGMLIRYNQKNNVVTEFSPPTPYTNLYSATADKNGEIWAGEMHGGRVARFNPRMHRWIEYQLPSVWSFDFSSWVDNSSDPVTYWYGDEYGYIVRVQPLE